MGPYAPLIPAILMLVAFSLRRFAPAGFMHSLGGATLIAFISGLLGAAAEAIASHGLTAAAIVPAVASFVMSFIATANPSTKATDEEPKVVKGSAGPFKVGLMLPFLFLGASLAMSGCGTPRAVIKDVTAACGIKVATAVTQTVQVLKTATSADAALAEITQIIGAASSDYEAIYCVVTEALKSLKAQRSTSGGLAPPDTQMRAFVAGELTLPSDPVSHGIAIGEQLLAERARLLVVSQVGAP